MPRPSLRAAALAASCAALIAASGCGGGDDDEGPPSADEVVSCLEDAGVAAQKAGIAPSQRSGEAEALLAWDGPSKQGIPAVVINLYEDPDDASNLIEQTPKAEKVGDNAIIAVTEGAGPKSLGDVESLPEIESCVD